ncbi:MAG: hypothetical protein JWN25_2432 [Verrucomicrobiales bacterium]|nr:hypothetical protein [Verrucomicrobiales bacterium]
MNNPITRRDIKSHQAVVPWAFEHQVEQDLLLCRTMAALFSDPFLRSQIAMRGGTLLHKVHLAPAVRYSEENHCLEVESVMIRRRQESW